MGLFRSVEYKYIAMVKVPVGYEYQPLKDMIKYAGLKPSRYIPLLKEMIRTYLSNIPTK